MINATHTQGRDKKITLNAALLLATLATPLTKPVVRQQWPVRAREKLKLFPFCSYPQSWSLRLCKGVPQTPGNLQYLTLSL